MLCLALWSVPNGAAGFQDHVFVVTGLSQQAGSASAVAIEAPWTATRDVEPVGRDPVVRHFYGLHYVLNRADGTVQVVDPADFGTRRTFSVGAGSNPQDILVVDTSTAYVSRFDSRWLYRVDPTTGIGFDAVDLGPLADADGLPEMAMLARDGRRLFVQVQRLDRETFAPVPPSYLAVVDLSLDSLVDVDPVLPGIQGIALTGTRPAFRMIVEPEARRLFVSEPGQWLDGAGGVEGIDLDTLEALGFVTTEAQIGGADIGEVTMISPLKGYLNVHTDLTLSSHVTAFSRLDGSNLGQAALSLNLARGFAPDPATGQMFFADPDVPSGVRVIDTATDVEATPAPIDVGLWPADLIVARDVSPGEAPFVTVEGPAAGSGALTLAFEPACGAQDHDIVYGPLEALRSYGCSGRVCRIGTLGRHEGFDPGPGSWFFFVVGTDGQGREGSYGRNSAAQERPAQAGQIACPAVQDLTRACD